MVDTKGPTTTTSRRRRFYSLCRPPSGEQTHDGHNPLRDLAAAWDATKVLLYYNERKMTNHHHHDNDELDDFQTSVLQDAVIHTLQSYSTAPCEKESSSQLGSSNTMEMSLSRRRLSSPPLMLTNLPEPSNVGHSAMAILAYTHALRLSLPVNDNNISLEGLTRGILSRQRSDGAFITTFHSPEEDNDDDIETGIHFYPGEAMVALMEVYALSESMPHIIDASTRDALVPAMTRAFDFYAKYYHEASPDTNYNIWQIQAFARLSDVLFLRRTVADYVLTLCQGICESRAWKYELARGRSFYPNLSTLEIACGLDALVDGLTVATAVMEGEQEQNQTRQQQQQQELRLEQLHRNVQHAVVFLEWSLARVPQDAGVGRGGLGYGGVQVFEQRLDVTGHAVSALIKLVNRLPETSAY
eukprot:scaffold5547_cov163-Amphora_coffeaeformis.AAC.8